MVKLNKRNDGFVKGLVFCLLLMLCIRLTFLLFPSDLLFAEPDELFRGVLTKQIISHNCISSLFDYLYNPYAGGSIVISILAVPFFYIFGDTVFSLKLVEILLALFSVFLLYATAYKYFGIKAALMACLMFIVPPQYLSQRSLMSIGDYCESILLSLIIIHIFLSIIRRITAQEGGDAKIARYSFLLGIMSGFGLWFHYINGITIITCLIVWFFIDAKFFIRSKFLFFLCGFGIGFLPWLSLNFTRNFQGCIAGRDYIWRHFFRNGFVDALNRLSEMVVSGLPNALMFKNGLLNNASTFFFSRAYYLLLIISILGLICMHRDKVAFLVRNLLKRKAKNYPGMKHIFIFFILINVMIFILIYSFYAIPTTITGVGFHDNRRIMPLFPCLIIAISIFLSSCLSMKRLLYRLFAFCSLFFFMVYGIVNNAPLFSKNNFGRSLSLKGYSYELLGWNIADSSLADIERWVKLISVCRINNLQQICKGIGQGIGDDLGDDIALEKFGTYEKKVQKLDENCLASIYYGMGIGTVSAVKNNGIKINDVTERIDSRYIKFFMRGYRKEARNDTR